MRYLIFLLLLIPFLLPQHVTAQTITGVVTDIKTGKPMPDVTFENIYTHTGGVTDTNGSFAILVNKGQLIEFRKLGYKIGRVRIPMGTIPPYFKIGLEEGALELEEVKVYDRYRNYRNDSLSNHELYKDAINYQKLTGLQSIQHPFTALSKHYRQMMSFQREYNFLEQMKYVDYTFNERTITNLTGLKGDSLVRYMRLYRPSYEELRAMPEYSFFSYIKETVNTWRKRQRNGGGRISN